MNPANAPSAEYLRVVGLPKRELERLVVRGEQPDAGTLTGWEFRGTNTPVITRLLRIRKFLKGFYAEESGRVFGYNMRARQGRLSDPWASRPDETAPKRFGFFGVRPPDPASRDNAYLHALLLDYSEGGNRGSVMNLLRDYLVRVVPGSDDLLIGKAYMSFGALRLPVGYFVLECSRPTDFRTRSV
jgi:hypothetical protein